MSFFWPTRTNPMPGFFGRIGQLAHFGGLALGLLALWALGNPAGPASWPAGAAYFALIYFTGRGLRFMFAGE